MLSPMINLWALVPALAILGLILSKFHDEKPAWSIELKRFEKKLAGYWTPLYIIVAPAAFLYNVCCMAVYGLLKLLDYAIQLLKWLHHWLWQRAFLWFWKNVIVIPVTLLARIIWHYVFVWVWRIFRGSFESMRRIFAWKLFKLLWVTAAASIFIYGLMEFLAQVLEVAPMASIGFIIALIPLIYGLAYGASAHRSDDLKCVNASTHAQAARGAAMRAMKYVLAAVVINVVVALVSASGLISGAGIVILGILINLSHLLSIIGVGVALILAFMTAILPVYHPGENESHRGEFLSLIKRIRDKGLQYILGTVFGGICAAIIAFLPALLVNVAHDASQTIKNGVLDQGMSSSNERLAEIKAQLAADTLSTLDWTNAQSDVISISQQNAQHALLMDFPLNVVEGNYPMTTDTLTWIAQLADSLNTQLASGLATDSVRMADLDREISDLDQAIAQQREYGSVYDVQRSEDGENWETIGSGLDVQSYVDQGLNQGTVYRYRVIARNSAGQSDWSGQAVARTNETSIAAPSALRAAAQSNFRVVLTWQDNAWNETSFEVERSNDRKEWTAIHSAASNTTEYVDANVADTLYYYRVHAIGAGDTASSGVIGPVRPSLNAPYAQVSEVVHDGVLVQWNHRTAFPTDVDAGDYTANDAPSIDYTELSSVAIMEAERARLMAIRDSVDAHRTALTEELSPRIAFAESKADTVSIHPVYLHIGNILGWLAAALMAGIILAFVLAYFGKQLLMIDQLTDGGGYYFIDEFNKVREADRNQPLLGLLLLAMLLALMTQMGAGVGKLSSFMPDLSMAVSIQIDEEISIDSEGEEMMEIEVIIEADAEEAVVNTYTIQGTYNTLWAELNDVFGAAATSAILELNEDRTYEAGREILLPMEE